MTQVPSFRLNITTIPCSVEALQRVFSRHLILGYPQETTGSAENRHGAGNHWKIFGRRFAA